MSRQLRFNIQDGVYHVMNRGLERRTIVRDDEDRRNWLRLFARVAIRRRWRVFAHVLIDNHYHAFLRTPDGDLSQGMHDCQSGYATLFNQRYDRVGPLFQGRFKAELVDTDGYGWALSRYIHLNPVRAGLCSDPFQYLWSTYRHYLNPRNAPSWLDWPAILAQYGKTESAARLAYKRFVDAGIRTPPRSPLVDAVDGWLLGRPQFVERWQAWAATENSATVADASPPATVTVDRVVALVAERFGVNAEALYGARGQQNQARDAALFLAREVLDEPVTALGERFGVGKSSVSEAVRRVKLRLSNDAAFRQLVDALRDELSGEGSSGSKFKTRRATIRGNQESFPGEP